MSAARGAERAARVTISAHAAGFRGEPRPALEGEMLYEWSRAGVEHAVEDMMRGHPQLQQPFRVAESRDGGDYTWHVELDPTRERRIARLTWRMIEDEQLDAIASAIEEATFV
jgi:hypothetical protein